MIKKTILFLSLLTACGGTTLFGQSSRSVPMLEMNADTRTAGMGDANMGESTGMYLYGNPTAFFRNEGNLYASYSFGMFPETGNAHQTYHAASAGYKLFDKHAIMVGFRYLGGLKIARVGEDGLERKPITPMDQSVDFVYAFQFTPHLSVYAGGNVIQSYIAKTGITGSMSAGIYYRNDLPLSPAGGSYSIGISLYDLGGRIKYGKSGTESNLPTSLGMGGSASLPFNKNHKLNAGLSMRYFMLPSQAKAFTGGAGVEYEMFDTAALRTGYHWGDDAGYFTLGLGFKVKFAHIDAAYSIAKDENYNLLRLGASVQF